MKTHKGYCTISIVAELFKITPQTLRIYEEKGLIQPSRSRGNKRLYDDEDLERIDIVLRLTRDLGVNLAGVEVILNMRDKMLAMEKQYQEIVELLFKEFQNTLQQLNVQDEEGLIVCNQRKLMQLKKLIMTTKRNLHRADTLTAKKNP